ncbi:hypothetical protein ACQP1O_15580 [Nocardia sp. CA-151230]|uniref:hypothetical protein n=1 Tax=Nocardia sp. CA-151230 TaxID=3239982 RepID=UPI003D8F0E10
MLGKRELYESANEPIDLPAAHTGAVARYLDWEIITSNRSRWPDVERRLPFPVGVVEFTDRRTLRTLSPTL